MTAHKIAVPIVALNVAPIVLHPVGTSVLANVVAIPALRYVLVSAARDVEIRALLPVVHLAHLNAETTNVQALVPATAAPSAKTNAKLTVSKNANLIVRNAILTAKNALTATIVPIAVMETK